MFFIYTDPILMYLKILFIFKLKNNLIVKNYCFVKCIFKIKLKESKIPFIDLANKRLLY